MRKIQDWIIGNPTKYSLEHRLFNLLAFLSVIFGIISVIQNLLLDIPAIAKWIVIVAASTLWIFYYISRVKKNFRVVILPYIIMSALFLGSDWFFRAGSYGVIHFVFIPLMFYVLVITKVKYRIPAMIFTLSVPVILMIVEYFKPDWLYFYPSKIARYADIIFEYLLCGILLGIGAILVIDNFRDERHKVEEKNKELNDKNHEILESIHYAGIIQHSILPEIEKMNEYFNQLYIISKPRDIVGGDFYWFRPVEQGFLLSVVDCTGHGVPGALMAMTANSVLNQIVSDYCKDDPAKILSYLNRIMRKTLGQDRENSYSNDGLDMGMCLIQPQLHRLFYSGAKLPLILQNKEEINLIHGDNFSIGYRESPHNLVFRNHELKISGRNRMFLYTDGLIHQIGGEKGLPFGTQPLIQIIQENHHMDVLGLGRTIEKNLKNYMGDETQRDDITLIAFEIEC